MQKRENVLLTIFCAISFIISIALLFGWFGSVTFGRFSALVNRLAMYFPIVPFLFLQLLLCKNVTRKWIKMLPLMLIVAVVVVCGIGYAEAGGWDGLVFLFVMIFSIAPVMGCLLGFAVSWFWRRQEYKISAQGYVALIGFPVLIIAVSVFAEWYSNQGVRTIHDIPSQEAVVSCFEEKGDTYGGKYK